jgi:hypothetical protein
VVVYDGVNVGSVHLRFPLEASQLPRGRCPVSVALLPGDVSPRHRRRGCCRVSSHRCGSDRRDSHARYGEPPLPPDVDVVESIQSAAHHHGMDGRGDMPSFAPIAIGPRRFFHRRCTTFRTRFGGVLFGLGCGREDWSAIPATPIAAYRSAHRFAVGQDTLHWRQRERPANRVDDKTRDAQTVTGRQSSISVGDEGPPGSTSECFSSSTPRPEVLRH